MNDQKQLWNDSHKKGEIAHYSSTPTDFSLEVIKIITPHSRVLELGCGAGNDSIAFQQAGHTVLSTDFSDVAINKNIKRFKDISNLTFAILNMESTIDFPENSFDVIYSRLSLHYFKDEITKRIFADVFKLLKPKGLLCFMCKSITDSLYGKGKKIENDMYEEHGHVRHFFSESYVKECLDDRFTIQKLESKSDVLYDRKSSFIEVIAKSNK